MRRLRGSDAELTAALASLEVELRVTEARGTVEAAAEAARSWAETSTSVLRKRDDLALIATGSGAFDRETILGTVASLLLDDRATVDRLAGLCEARSRELGAMPTSAKASEVKRLTTAIAEHERELAKRGIEARRVELERELSALEA